VALVRDRRRGERDFWSWTEDVELLQAHLAHAREVATLELPRATHHVHLDRDEAGRRRLVEAVRAFLAR
jgi:hypothetical protein